MFFRFQFNSRYCVKLFSHKVKEVKIPENIIKDIPYLETLFSGRFTTDHNENGIIKTEEFNPDLLKVIVKYLEEKEIYKLFACLPKDQDIVELLEMFRFLALVPPIDTKLSEIKEILDGPPSLNVTSQIELVEYGFALFYSTGQIQWQYEQKLRNMIFNTISYVFKSSDDSFKCRAKYHLKQLALKCVTFSYNQYHKIIELEVDGSLDNSDAESVDSDIFGFVDDDEICGFGRFGLFDNYFDSGGYEEYDDYFSFNML